MTVGTYFSAVPELKTAVKV